MNRQEISLNVFDVFIISVVGLLIARIIFLTQLIILTVLLGLFESKIEFLFGFFFIVVYFLLLAMLILLSVFTFSLMRYLFSKNEKWQIWVAFGVVAIIAYFTRLIIGNLGSFDVKSAY